MLVGGGSAVHEQSDMYHHPVLAETVVWPAQQLEVWVYEEIKTRLKADARRWQEANTARMLASASDNGPKAAPNGFFKRIGN